MSNVTLAAYKSMVSDLLLRAKQAEEMVGLLMNEKIPADQMTNVVVPKIMQHMAERELERSTQLAGVIDVSLLALNAAAQATTDQNTKASLAEVIKGLTLTANHAAPKTKQVLASK